MWAFTVTPARVVSGLVVIGVAIGFFLLSRASLPATSLQLTLATLIADIRYQQQLSRMGEVVGKYSVVPFGLVLQKSQYILFQGTTYIPGHGPEKQMPVPAPIVLETTLPGGLLLFESGSGNIIGFDAEKHTITLRDTKSQAERTISFNLYGVITLKK